MGYTEDLDPRPQTIEAEFARLREENLRLRQENARLRALLGLLKDEESLSCNSAPTMAAPAGANQIAFMVTNHSSPEAKIALFRSLFRGKEDVYAARWEGKNGKSGYSPACKNEWDRAFCGKPKVKCAECEYRQFLPLTDQVIYDHLAGKRTVGIYPLLPDETCWFLAADFDKASWQEDVIIFLGTCDEMGVPAALERSRSGNGSHVWIFFECPIPAHLARKLGCALLTRTIERRHQIGLDSYDRLFPNQDTMPKGGFGNLIALPLQRRPRDQGNSLFLDRDFQPYPDQWKFLSTLRKMRVEEVENLVMEAARAGSIIGVRLSLIGAGGEEEDEEENPWTLPPSKKRKSEKPITGPLPEKVRIIQNNLLYIEKEGLPPALLSRLVRLAAFQNPEFYKAQAMRLSTFGPPGPLIPEFMRHILWQAQYCE
ncbi:MAG TPA: hypothetical protein GXX51_02245 [Firmicutes bacterium]|nr:hypothetical protein [Bacillota bacterium]